MSMILLKHELKGKNNAILCLEYFKSHNPMIIVIDWSRLWRLIPEKMKEKSLITILK
jgi:hypothetical protein